MEKKHLYDKIISPFVTEKSTNLSEQNKIVFKVPSSANKKNLKKNIEKIFKRFPFPKAISINQNCYSSRFCIRFKSL